MEVRQSVGRPLSIAAKNCAVTDKNDAVSDSYHYFEEFWSCYLSDGSPTKSRAVGPLMPSQELIRSSDAILTLHQPQGHQLKPAIIGQDIPFTEDNGRMKILPPGRSAALPGLAQSAHGCRAREDRQVWSTGDSSNTEAGPGPIDHQGHNHSRPRESCTGSVQTHQASSAMARRESRLQGQRDVHVSRT